MTQNNYQPIYDHMALVTDKPVLLVGAAQIMPALFYQIAKKADHLVAADGGAAQTLALGYTPEHVWGDFDSLDPAIKSNIGSQRLHHITEQESTDFDKALRHISAPLIYGLGFTGQRRDHELAAYNSLIRHANQSIVLVSDQDLICLMPPEINMNIAVGERVSLFPFGKVTGRSEGLNWPIEGLNFSPSGRVGTSNHAVRDFIEMTFDQPAMLGIFPTHCLDQLTNALHRAPKW